MSKMTNSACLNYHTGHMLLARCYITADLTSALYPPSPSRIDQQRTELSVVLPNTVFQQQSREQGEEAPRLTDVHILANVTRTSLSQKRV